MPELMIDFITSLDGYGAADGWPGWWGLEGPEYLAWLGDQPEADYTVLMGANTYRLMSGLATDGEPGTDVLAGLSKIVFSSTLTEPLSWPNTRLIAQDPVEAVREMKDDGHRVDAHDRQPHAVPLPPACRSRRPFSRGRVPSDHGKHRQGSDLRRLPRRLPRPGGQSHLRRSARAPRVRPDGSGWATRCRLMTRRSSACRQPDRVGRAL